MSEVQTFTLIVNQPDLDDTFFAAVAEDGKIYRISCDDFFECLKVSVKGNFSGVVRVDNTMKGYWDLSSIRPA